MDKAPTTDSPLVSKATAIPQQTATAAAELFTAPTEQELGFMRLALKEAEKAAKADEVPVGAVIVKNGEIIAKAHNLKERRNCALFHAETVAISKAAKKLNNWWLEDCELYVTLEPCPMCAGAVINSRLKRVVFGAFDSKAGCLGSVFNLTEKGKFNHDVEVKGGVMSEECAAVLSEFFRNKRKK